MEIMIISLKSLNIIKYDDTASYFKEALTIYKEKEGKEEENIVISSISSF